MSVEDLANDNLAWLDDEQIRAYAEMAQAEIERLEGWLERISREYDMQVSVIMPAIEEWQEDKTNG